MVLSALKESLSGRPRPRFLRSTPVDDARPGQAAAEYDETPYRIGLHDGRRWLDGTAGEAAIRSAARADQARFVEGCRQEIAHLIGQQAETAHELSAAEVRLEAVRTRVAEAQTAQRHADADLTAWRNSQVAAATGVGGRLRRLKQVLELRAVCPRETPGWLLLLGGLFMLAASGGMLAADIGITAGALYAFGFDAPIGATEWTAVLLHPSLWMQNWFALAFCLSIAATALAIKLLYEKIKYRRAHGVDSVMFWVWCAMGITTAVVIGGLAHYRISYLMNAAEDPTGETGKVLDPAPGGAGGARLVVITCSVMFLILGAVLLSEGSEMLAEGWARTWRRHGGALNAFETGPYVLHEACAVSQARVSALESQEQVILQEMRQAQARQTSLGHDIESRTAFMERIVALEGDLIDADVALYQLGRQHGARSHAARGAYGIIREFLQSRIGGLP